MARLAPVLDTGPGADTMAHLRLSRADWEASGQPEFIKVSGFENCHYGNIALATSTYSRLPGEKDDSGSRGREPEPRPVIRPSEVAPKEPPTRLGGAGGARAIGPRCGI